MTSRKIALAVAAAVATAGFTVAAAAPAQSATPGPSTSPATVLGAWADRGDIGKRLTVCADSLGVRHEPGGHPFADLHYPQTFDVKDLTPGQEWVWGFAYGNVNSHGWVQNGWFCDA